VAWDDDEIGTHRARLSTLFAILLQEDHAAGVFGVESVVQLSNLPGILQLFVRLELILQKERQKDRKTERQKDRKTDRQNLLRNVRRSLFHCFDSG